jgi:glucuronate isomerase
MSQSLVARLKTELDALVLIDPHTHINPHSAASKTLAEILGYHYYTELAHSAGLAKSQIEEAGLDPKTKVGRLVEWLDRLDNTIQVDWLIRLCQKFFGFQDEQITTSNWEALYDASAAVMSRPHWETECLAASRLESVFLTNDFDDPLEGFDRTRYIPCLRTDELVFHLTKPEVRQRLMKSTGIDVHHSASLQDAIGQLFRHFCLKGAKACAISLPPWFTPRNVGLHEVRAPLQKLLANDAMSDEEQAIVSLFVFWTIADHCQTHRLPFDLMIGVNRRVYPGGVYQGQDLFDQRVSLIQYQALFNAFPSVKFPVSVLAQTSNQELVSYSWIFPNVLPHGHWWYSNIPACILPDCRARLQAAPRNKQIGYYSDMYKLEFGWPKFDMYRQVLATALAEDFVQARGWSEDRALELGRQVLRGNVETTFGLSG